MSSMQTAKKGLWAEIRQPVTALKADFRQLLQISWHPDPEIRSQGLSHRSALINFGTNAKVGAWRHLYFEEEFPMKEILTAGIVMLATAGTAYAACDSGERVVRFSHVSPLQPTRWHTTCNKWDREKRKRAFNASYLLLPPADLTVRTFFDFNHRSAEFEGFREFNA